jgi:hypothetical protein
MLEPSLQTTAVTFKSTPQEDTTMNNAITDVMIHTVISLSDEQFSEVASQIKALDGVIEFNQNSRNPSLIMVAYDAGKTRSLYILNKLTRLGFNASLVGI